MGAPAILFIDEIDSIVGKRSNSTNQSGVGNRLLSTLLNEMDGIGIKLDEKKKESKKLELEGAGSEQVCYVVSPFRCCPTIASRLNAYSRKIREYILRLS